MYVCVYIQFVKNCLYFLYMHVSFTSEGKSVKAELGEVSSLQHSSKKDREREEQEINDSEEERDLLEDEEEEVCENKSIMQGRN